MCYTRALSAALLLMLPNIAAAQRAAREPSVDVAAIRRARAQFNDAITQRDLESMARVLAPGYHLVTGRSAQSHGADSAMARWRSSFAGDSAYGCVRTTLRVQVNRAWGLAEESGNWRCRIGLGGPSVATGSYTAKWQRDTAGRWRIQVEVFTTLACTGTPAGCVPPDPIPADSSTAGSRRD